MFETETCERCKEKRNFYNLQRCSCCEKTCCNECTVWYWGVPFKDYGISGFVDPETPVCARCDEKVNRVRDLIENIYYTDPAFNDKEKILIEKFRKCCKEH